MIKHLLCIGIAAIALPLDASHVTSVEVPRIRGISISSNSLYTPNPDFECLDGSRRITFDKVNDDYCDCGDGSDEPGTSACPNGSFFCQNSGYKSLRIPSGKVNDGICDCCDATDEYASGKNCIDICHELGKEASAEAEKAAELAREGNKIRLEMLEKGQKLKSEYTVKLTKLKSDHQEAELLKQEKDMIKNEAEEKEKIALEKYKLPEPDPTQVVNEELAEAEAYFKRLDQDESGTVTAYEILRRQELDDDGNGRVTEEEARYFLNDEDEINFEDFREKSWPNVKALLLKQQGIFEQPEPPKKVDNVADNQNHPEQVKNENDDELNDGLGGSDDDDEEDEYKTGNDDHEDGYQENAHDDNEEPEKLAVEYDAETQSIVDEANAARIQYQQAEKALLDLQNEIRNLESKIDRDYGPDDVFAPLDGECFQYTNFEYVYSICMYGRATQSAKSGGSEVLLGHWKEWTGNANNKYGQMKFGGGITCWNGPARSCVVDLQCGLENKLISVAEPRRCEYTMVFETPAVCNTEINTNEVHDEL